MIDVSGYVLEEKLAIAQKYLIPQLIQSTGLKDANVTIDEPALTKLIHAYCRESGVRNLQKYIEKVGVLKFFNAVRNKFNNLFYFVMSRSSEKQPTP